MRSDIPTIAFPANNKAVNSVSEHDPSNALVIFFHWEESESFPEVVFSRFA